MTDALKSFDDLIGRDLLLITEDEAQAAIGAFRSLFSSNQQLKEILLRRRPIVRPNEPKVMEQLQELILLDGLITTLTGTASLFPEPNPVGRHFEMFAHLYMVFWNHIPVGRRGDLESKITDVANNPEKLPALYFEFAVGALYWRTGCRVVPNDWLKAGTYNNDYDVSRGKESFAVEVKTIDWRTGNGFDPDTLSHAIGSIRTFVENHRDRYPEYHAILHLLDLSTTGDRRKDRIAFDDNVQRLVLGLEKGDSVVSRSAMAISIWPKCPRVGADYQSAKEFLRVNGFVTAVHSTDASQPGIVSVKSPQPRSLSKRIGDVVRESCKRQLNPAERHIFWIQLVGNHTLSSQDELDIASYFGWDTRLGQKFRKQNEEDVELTSGLFGLHVGGEPFAKVMDDGRIQYVFNPGMIAALSRKDAVIAYRSTMLNEHDTSGFEFRL